MQTLPTIIIEANAVLRDSLKHFLENAGIPVAASVSSAPHVATLANVPADVAFVLSCRPGADAVADVRLLKALNAKSRVIVVGGRSDIQSTLEAVQSGATVYLDDRTSAAAFLKALELASHGLATVSIADRGPLPVVAESSARAFSVPVSGVPVLAVASAPASETPAAAPQTVTRAETPPSVSDTSPAPSFSPRETAILQLLQEGAPNKQIARQLSLTEATVKVHLKSILRKIRVRNRTQAAVWAMAQDTFIKSQAKAAQPDVRNGSGTHDHWGDPDASHYEDEMSAKN